MSHKNIFWIIQYKRVKPLQERLKAIVDQWVPFMDWLPFINCLMVALHLSQ